MARLTVELTDQEYDLLCALAKAALRSPSNQALYMLRELLRENDEAQNRNGYCGPARRASHRD